MLKTFQQAENTEDSRLRCSNCSWHDRSRVDNVLADESCM